MSQFPFIVLNYSVQLYCKVRNKHMRVKMLSAGRGNMHMVGTVSDEDLGNGRIETIDLAGQRVWQMDNIPVVMKFQNGFGLWNDVDLTQSRGSL